jgi:hypothetical protein
MDFVDLLAGVDLHPQLIRASRPVLSCLTTQKLIDMAFLQRFWVKYHDVEVLAECLDCLEPDDVVPFLSTLTDANCLKAIVKECPGLVDPALNLMFRQIRLFGEALVELCDVKDMRVISVMVDIVKRNLAEEAASNELLRVVLALIACSESPPFDAAMISQLSDRNCSLDLVLEVLYAFLTHKSVTLHMDGTFAQKLWANCEGNREMFWNFMSALLESKKDIFDLIPKTLLELLAQEDSFTPAPGHFTIRLFEMMKFDSRVLLFIFSKSITDIDVWYFFKSAVEEFLEKEGSCHQILDFFDDGWANNELNLCRIILEILDITDGRIDLSAKSYVRYHQACKKSRPLVLKGPNDEVVRLNARPDTSRIAIRNVLGVLSESEVELVDEACFRRLEGRNRIHIDDLLLSKLSAETFIPLLQNPELVPPCYQILK